MSSSPNEVSLRAAASNLCPFSSRHNSASSSAFFVSRHASVLMLAKEIFYVITCASAIYPDNLQHTDDEFICTLELPQKSGTAALIAGFAVSAHVCHCYGGASCENDLLFPWIAPGCCLALQKLQEKLTGIRHPSDFAADAPKPSGMGSNASNFLGSVQLLKHIWDYLHLDASAGTFNATIFANHNFYIPGYHKWDHRCRLMMFSSSVPSNLSAVL